MDWTTPPDPNLAYGGPCARCGQEHTLPAGPALEPARTLLDALTTAGRIDFEAETPDPRLSVDYLRGPARGKMFGVLAATDRDGKPVTVKAFSSQYNGIWRVPGWADPVMDADEFTRLSAPVDREIKMLGRAMETTTQGEREELAARRKDLSRDLMGRLHALYTLRNFRGETRPLTDFFPGAPPTGAADCCTPKLLHHAAVHGLTPLGVVEFYVGRTNASATREHGVCYPPCADKCRPILGFMLCGLDGQGGVA